MLALTSSWTKTQLQKYLTFSSTWSEHGVILVVFLLTVGALRMPFVTRWADEVSPNPLNNYQLEPLSFGCWMVHYPLMLLGWELFRSFQRLAQLQQPRHDKVALMSFQNMAGIFGVSFVQGWLILLNHASIVGPTKEHWLGSVSSYALEVLLWNVGSQFLIRWTVFCTAVLGILPTWTTSRMVAVPFLAWAVATHRLHLGNLYGRILATVAMATVCFATQSTQEGASWNFLYHWLFRLGYVLTALCPAFIPDMSNDFGHAVGAFMLNASILCMVLGVNQMRSKLEESDTKKSN